jgi:hypothetical protein
VMTPGKKMPRITITIPNAIALLMMAFCSEGLIYTTRHVVGHYELAFSLQ